MRLMELRGNLPKTAGAAKLDFYPPSKDGNNTITRKKDVISIPAYVDLELFSLERDWKQFLAVLCLPRNNRDNAEVFFGETDENPFLVQMDPSVLSKFFLGGTAGFYAAIRPERISQLEDKLCRTARRQGDIFAIHTGYTWEGLKRAAAILGGIDVTVADRKAVSLFDTRHLLTGQYGRFKLGGTEMQFASGTVVAPDHADLTMTRPYLVEQTAFLYDPPRAD